MLLPNIRAVQEILIIPYPAPVVQQLPVIISPVLETLKQDGNRIRFEYRIDASILHNKIDFIVEYYKKTITGLLFSDQAVSTAGGASRPSINIGDVQNTGVDASANYHGTISRDFKFDIGANITTYKSLVVNIPGQYFDAGGTRIGNFVRNQVGQAIGAYYGYKVIGLFGADTNEIKKLPTQQDAAPGRFRYLDANNSGSITDSDRVFFGNPNPKFTYGVNINASYKNFDLTLVLYGSQGNDVINYVRYWTDFWASFQGIRVKIYCTTRGLRNTQMEKLPSWKMHLPSVRIPFQILII